MAKPRGISNIRKGASPFLTYPLRQNYYLVVLRGTLTQKSEGKAPGIREVKKGKRKRKESKINFKRNFKKRRIRIELNVGG
ncbi:hypothetical protein [Caldisericum sp. AR60]|uniref:hypothetical protein n=1 Tax=Caldisericum sp. AR60 TaxID=3397852 RepID=UPI0039FC1C49